jgi:hypothetical protein
MAGEVGGGRPMAWHAAADDGVSGVRSDTRESVAWPAHHEATGRLVVFCSGLFYSGVRETGR